VDLREIVGHPAISLHAAIRNAQKILGLKMTAKILQKNRHSLIVAGMGLGEYISRLIDSVTERSSGGNIFFAVNGAYWS
jgi:hypothetical protein